MIERDRKGGRIEREIESRDEEDAGEWWRHRKNNEHKGDKSNQVTQFFIKITCCSSLTNLLL